MAVARDAEGQQFALAARSLVGRSGDCLVCIENPHVSAEHAVIFWSGDRWYVRDLGSKNGTQVNGERVASGARTVLAAGACLAFAGVEWWLVSDLAPVARAICTQTGRSVEDDGDGLLTLEPAPLRAVVFDGSSWVLAAPDEPARSIADQEVIATGSKRWRFELPPVCGTVIDSTDLEEPAPLCEVSLRFSVSRDGEHVSVELQSPGMGAIQLPSLTHQHVLLSLARARLSDLRNGTPPGEAGWVYADELQRELAMDRVRVNVELYRARRLFKRYGVSGSDAIVERRTDTQQVRIGLPSLEIVDG